jgi:hypothetical protein
MRIKIFLFTTLCALASCHTSTTPHTTLDRETLLQVYVSLLKERARTQGAGTDSTDALRTRRVLERFGTTVEEFRATINAYDSDIRLWKDFYQEAARRLEDTTHGEKGTPAGVSEQ